MKYICGIDEGNRFGIGGKPPKNMCTESFGSLEALMEHIKVKHSTPLGPGRKDAKGMVRDENGHWINNPKFKIADER